MTIEHRKGDLFSSGLSTLAHGVNCMGVMGAGIARSFRDRWPGMYEDYRQACAARTLQPGYVLTWGDPPTWDRAPRQDPAIGITVFCLATQRGTGPDARPWAIATALGQMILACQNLGIRQVGMPWIGCGIGGLDPDDLWACLEPFRGAPVDLVVYEYAP